jgi:hypothetical protein
MDEENANYFSARCTSELLLPEQREAC